MKKAFTLCVIILLVLLPLAVIVGCQQQAAPAPPPTEPTPSQPEASPPEQLSPPTFQLPDLIREFPKSTELINRRYSWQYGGKEWVWEMKIPQALYDYYKKFPRPPTQNFSVYVTHPLDDNIIGDLVDEIERVALREAFGELEKVEFVAAFVQSFPYTSDSVTTSYDEYPRYPIETLVDSGGDCEDTSILIASLLNSMNYGVTIIILPDHCAIGVLGGEGIYGSYYEYEGGKYYYVETTNTGWGIGEIPDEHKGATANLYGMVPTPILTHTWEEGVGEGSILKLEVIVENLGTAAADEVHAVAGFDAGEGKLWNAQESQPFELSVNQHIAIKFTLKAPIHKHTRLVVQIINDGHAVDESYSEWFDTP